MGDKFSYYDFIANIVPSVFLLWGLSITPLREVMHLGIDGTFTEGMVFLVLAYILGLLLQAIAKLSIERLVKHLFWGGAFFSQVCLLRDRKIINESLRSTVVHWAKNHGGFAEDTLKKLDDDSDEAREIGNLIFRKADTYTVDRGQAQKAHTQNILYSLYRDLCLSSVILVAILGWYLLYDLPFRTPAHWVLFAFALLCCLVFLVRTRNSGELYVKGIFWALPSN